MYQKELISEEDKQFRLQTTVFSSITRCSVLLMVQFCSIGALLINEVKNPCKNLEVKAGGIFISKGAAYFQENKVLLPTGII